jgi:hypothetical protein
MTFEVIIGLAGLILTVILWLFDRRRNVNTAPPVLQPASGIVGVVQGLSPLEVTRLRRVADLSSEFDALEEKWPTNSPMNTAESAEAKGKVLLALSESELMQTIGVQSLSAFRVICQNLERYRLVECVVDETREGPHIYITDLGLAAIRDCLSRT